MFSSSVDSTSAGGVPHGHFDGDSPRIPAVLQKGVPSFVRADSALRSVYLRVVFAGFAP